MVFDNKHSTKIGLIFMMLIMIVFSACSNIEENRDLKASSFEECVKKGGNIAESYPRQCFLGRDSFVEKIDENENDTKNIIKTFRGEIIKIEDGKDGSSVTLKNRDNETVIAKVSIPNLGYNSKFNFSSIKIGNIIEVRGETFEMTDNTHLTANYALVIFDKHLEEECIDKGGKYEQRGMMQMYMCNMPTKDAGKSCDDMSDCEGICEAKDSKGICSEWTINFGCIPVFENGEEVTICID